MEFLRQSLVDISLTSPPKTRPLARKSDCAEMGPTGGAHDSKTAHRGTDHRSAQMEDENRRLKQMVAEQALDIQALKAVTAKNW